jgi:hypothetical protein
LTKGPVIGGALKGIGQNKTAPVSTERENKGGEAENVCSRKKSRNIRPFHVRKSTKTGLSQPHS